MLVTKTRAARIAFTTVMLVGGLAVVPMAFAGKGGNGNSGVKNGGTAPAYAGTLSGPVMIVDQNGDGLPNVGDSVTFNVISTAPYPFVQLSCSQNGSVVEQQTLGFFGGRPTTFYLGGMAWTGGAADCTATLYSVSFSGSVEPVEATLSFQVDA